MTDTSRYCVECERLQAELDALQVKFTDACFEVDAWRARMEIEEQESGALKAEVDRMRPVVEAAPHVRDFFVNASDDDRWLDADEIDRVQGDLIDAVDAYRAAKGADDE